ncbi:MAG: hypothetical protein U0263_07815 [Polyangiaceae bacterium]
MERSSSERKREFVRCVAAATQRLLEAEARRTNACVAPHLGPPLLARRFRAERLPGDAELAGFAERFARWVLGLAAAEERPYSEDDLGPAEDG